MFCGIEVILAPVYDAVKARGDNNDLPHCDFIVHVATASTFVCNLMISNGTKYVMCLFLVHFVCLVFAIVEVLLPNGSICKCYGHSLIRLVKLGKHFYDTGKIYKNLTE